MARNEIDNFVTPSELKENPIINANKFQSTFRNELTAKKSALGDIKNYFQNSPSQSRADGKLAKEAINAEQLSLFESLNKINADECFDDKFSSESVDYHKVWADKLAMTDEEIDRVLAPGFATYGNDLKPPPSPEPYEDLAYVSFYEPEPQMGTPPSLSFSEDDEENKNCGLNFQEDSLFNFSAIDTDDDDDGIGIPFIQRMRF